jgi:hypothetical protein
MNKVQMAAELYNMRDRAKRLCGDNYFDRMAQIGSGLQDIAKKSNKGLLETAIDLAKERYYVGIDLMMIMAAVVELTEPSK